MSLLIPRVVTPARWAAHRRNGHKSIGPRAARGKAPSREDLAYTKRVRQRANQAWRDPERSLEPTENKGSSENKNPAKLTSS